MSTLASNTGVDAYDRAFQASLGLYQSDLATITYDAQNFAGNSPITTNQALINHLRRVYAAGMSNGVNVDALLNQLRQLGAL